MLRLFVRERTLSFGDIVAAPGRETNKSAMHTLVEFYQQSVVYVFSGVSRSFVVLLWFVASGHQLRPDFVR